MPQIPNLEIPNSKVSDWYFILGSDFGFVAGFFSRTKQSLDFPLNLSVKNVFTR